MSESVEERNHRPAKYWGWPDRGPWTAYREWLLFVGFALVGCAFCGFLAVVEGAGWLGFVANMALLFGIGVPFTVGIIQVVVRPFYERFGDDIGPSEPWLLPTAPNKEQQ